MGLESVVHIRVADLKPGLLRELVPAKVKGIGKSTSSCNLAGQNSVDRFFFGGGVIDL